MRALLVLFTLCLVVIQPVSVPVQPQSPAPHFAFINVTVIDMTSAVARPGMTVVVTGNRISAIGETGATRVPEGGGVIEARGKFLIPGLWDMHQHTTYNTVREVEEVLFPTLIANGVTGIRDPQSYSSIKQINEWRKDIAAGKLTGPRLYEGHNIDGKKSGGLRAIIVRTEREGRQAVQSIKRSGYDFVKVYSYVSREAYFAIAGESKRQGVPFAGHLPFSVTAIEASDAGQKSIEHLSNIWFECSTQSDEIRKQMIAINSRSGSDRIADVIQIESEKILLQEQALDSYSEQKASEIFAHFARNGTWQCPTLVVDKAFAHFGEISIGSDSRTRYMPLSKRVEAKTMSEVWQALKPERVATLKRLHQKELEMVGKMHRAGVGILAGTDAPFLGVFYPGFSLHDELGLLVQAGLTPVAALQAATREPAKYLGLLDTLGTIEKGKIADLVLLAADPLADISNTRRIDAVVVNGRLLTKEALQRILTDAEAAAGRN